MIKSRRIDAICCGVLAWILAVTCLFMNSGALGITALARELGYESRLFDDSTVHTLEIVVDDWEGFLENCTDEEYIVADLVIDGEPVQNVGLRAKGNTSMTSVASYGNDRYSFKIEVDHYDSGQNYYGLDKFCLNNIIQDNTWLKDYLVYTMMADMGVASPLCSFVYITINGEDWGLYLAVEGVGESFLTRNYGAGYGELYKPDSMSFGGGKGNGRDFNMDALDIPMDIEGNFDFDDSKSGIFQNRGSAEDIFSSLADLSAGEIAEALKEAGMDPTILDTVGAQNAEQAMEALLQDADMRQVVEALRQSDLLSPGDDNGKTGFFGGGGMGSKDTMLQYIDDDPESYSNIFSSAKTDPTDADEQRLIVSLKLLSQVVFGEADAEMAAEAVDIETVIRYFVVHDFVCNEDSYTGFIIHNYYLYEEDGVMEMIPWDYNLAFGGFGGNGGDLTETVNSPIDSPVSGAISERPMAAWIFADEEYTALYHQIYAELIERWFDSGYFEQLFDQTVALISPYVKKDPTAFCSYEQFTAGAQTLREFCLLRAKSVSGQLDGTIPSTGDGQNQDSSALVDASALDGQAMGGQQMGGDRDGGMQPPDGAAQAKRPDKGEAATFAPPSKAADSDGTGADGDSQAFPPTLDGADQQPFSNGFPEDTEGAPPMGSPPEGFAVNGAEDMRPANGMPDRTASAGQWVWLAASIGILLIGIADVKRYRRW